MSTPAPNAFAKRRRLWPRSHGLWPAVFRTNAFLVKRPCASLPDGDGLSVERAACSTCYQTYFGVEQRKSRMFSVDG
jgi:hypothetical protein